MLFRFYSAIYVTEDKKAHCRFSDIEFDSLEEATIYMEEGAICQDDLKVSFIPVVCEQIGEVAE